MQVNQHNTMKVPYDGKNKESGLASKFGENFNLKLLMLIFKMNFQNFLIAISITTAIAYGYLNYVVPKFVTTGRLIVKQEHTSESLSFDQFDFESISRNTEQERELLYSEHLLGRVVDSLKLKNKVYRQGDFRDYELFKYSPFAIDIEMHEKFIDSKLMIEPRSDYSFALQYEEQGVLYEYEGKFNESLNTAHFNLTLDINDGYFMSNIVEQKFTIIPHSRSEIVAEVRSKLIIRPEGSDIPLKYEDSKPARAKEVVNTLMDIYLSFVSEQDNRGSSQVLEFLETRTAKLKEQIEVNMKLIQQYEKKYHLGLYEGDNDKADVYHQMQELILDIGLEQNNLTLIENLSLIHI